MKGVTIYKPVDIDVTNQNIFVHVFIIWYQEEPLVIALLS